MLSGKFIANRERIERIKILFIQTDSRQNFFIHPVQLTAAISNANIENAYEKFILELVFASIWYFEFATDAFLWRAGDLFYLVNLSAIIATKPIRDVFLFHVLEQCASFIKRYHLGCCISHAIFMMFARKISRRPRISVIDEMLTFRRNRIETTAIVRRFNCCCIKW